MKKRYYLSAYLQSENEAGRVTPLLDNHWTAHVRPWARKEQRRQRDAIP